MPFPQDPKTFTLYNYGTGTATISSLAFATSDGTQHRADLSGFGASTTYTNATLAGLSVSLAPAASIPFTLDYTNSNGNLTTYDNILTVYGTVNGFPDQASLDANVVVSSAPVGDPGIFDGGGGGDSSPASCSDSSSCSAGGGGGECFRAGTLISMADRTVKNIEDVIVGDKVLSADGKAVNTVKYVEHSLTQGTSYQNFYAPKGIKPFATENHPMVVNNKWVSANSKLSQKLYPWIETGQLEEFDMEPTDNQIVWNLWVGGDHTYQVNGFGTNSLVDDGGWLRVAVEQGYMTKEQITEVTHAVSNSSSAVAYGALILSNLVADLDRPWLTKYVADMMLGNTSRIPMDLAIIAVGSLAMATKKIKNILTKNTRI
jgi:hypothetical protein